MTSPAPHKVGNIVGQSKARHIVMPIICTTSGLVALPVRIRQFAILGANVHSVKVNYAQLVHQFVKQAVVDLGRSLYPSRVNKPTSCHIFHIPSMYQKSR